MIVIDHPFIYFQTEILHLLNLQQLTRITNDHDIGKKNRCPAE